MRILPLAAAPALGAAFVSVGVAASANAGSMICDYYVAHGMTGRPDYPWLCGGMPCVDSRDAPVDKDGNIIHSPPGCDPSKTP